MLGQFACALNMYRTFRLQMTASRLNPCGAHACITLHHLLETSLQQCTVISSVDHLQTSCMLQDTSTLHQQVHELDASLAQLRKECSHAVTTAHLTLGRPSVHPGSPRTSGDGSGTCIIEDAVQQLVAALKVLTFAPISHQDCC